MTFTPLSMATHNHTEMHPVENTALLTDGESSPLCRTTRVDHALPERQMASVKNTFLHIDYLCEASPLRRLQSCPAEVGMSYFFEKIGRSPARGSGTCPCPAALLQRQPSAAKTPRTMRQTDLPDVVEEETLAEEAAEIAPMTEEEQSQQGHAEDDEVLGAFFTAKKGKRHSVKRNPAPWAKCCPGRIVEMSTVENANVTKDLGEEQLPVEQAKEEERKPELDTSLEEEETGQLVEAEERHSAPASQRVSWADQADSDDEYAPSVAVTEVPEQVEAKGSEEETSDDMDHGAADQRPRWADLEESDDESAPTAAVQASEREAEHKRSGELKEAGSKTTVRCRPVFDRPGRDARMRQASEDVKEICGFEFDDVDAASQMGLTGRMLVMLKSLAQSVIFWEGEEKQEEEKFLLLGLKEEDMYAIGKYIRRAGKLIDERKFRDAFDQMCKARRWLHDREWAATERTRRMEKAAENETMSKKKTKRSEDDRGKGEAVVDDEKNAQEDEWQVVGVPEKKKKKRTADMGEQETVAVSSGRKCSVVEQPPRLVQEEKDKKQRPPSTLTPPSSSERPRRNPRDSTREPNTKFLCRFPVQIEAEVKGGFRVARRIFGPGGENMKSIARDTAAKLRLRGRGSGFKEGPEMREADEPLVLCVSAENGEGYRAAIAKVSDLFERIYGDYYVHCTRHGLAQNTKLVVRCNEHPSNPW